MTWMIWKYLVILFKKHYLNSINLTCSTYRWRVERIVTTLIVSHRSDEHYCCEHPHVAHVPSQRINDASQKIKLSRTWFCPTSAAFRIYNYYIRCNEASDNKERTENDKIPSGRGRPWHARE
jgi:hypothetical protein